MRIDSEFLRVSADPERRRTAVDNGCREAVFGREPVVHGKEPATAGVGQCTADGVVRVEAARDQSTAVEIDQSRRVVGVRSGVGVAIGVAVGVRLGVGCGLAAGGLPSVLVGRDEMKAKD